MHVISARTFSLGNVVLLVCGGLGQVKVVDDVCNVCYAVFGCSFNGTRVKCALLINLSFDNSVILYGQLLVGHIEWRFLSLVEHQLNLALFKFFNLRLLIRSIFPVSSVLRPIDCGVDFVAFDPTVNQRLLFLRVRRRRLVYW